MKPDKQVKAEFREKASRQPGQNYPTAKLKSLGYSRGQCGNCKKFFWSTDTKRKICGDSACQGGYTFIGNSPAKKKLDYIESWQAFENFFKKLGYMSLPRKPVVARWRPDVYWVGASVYGFQPWVVSGEIKPPSNSVVIPQLSLRFNDIDNVGITGSHYVCFDMFGQLHFEPKEKYDMPLYLEEYFNWINKGMGVPKEELIIHEDAWAGGGNFGPCMEFFSRGCEIGNQVYMQYKVLENGFEELDIKVLDMGQGHERVPWFTHGNSTSYETTFPTVVKWLKELTGVKVDEKLMQKFLPYSAYLNVDEVEDIDKTWGFVAKQLKIDVKELKGKILPLAALYSIAEHSRAALVAINDAALPSNVGGGYNLRTILRRMFDFTEEYGWKIDLGKLTELHASYLKPMYPELGQNLKDVNEIIENERLKYNETKARSRQIVAKLVQSEISTEKLIELYDSNGISPELVKREAAKAGKAVKVPDDFYAKVSEKHEKVEQETATKKAEKLSLEGIAETEVIYYSDYKLNEFNAKILKLLDNKIILDKTAFYPTSGGQLHDIGKINGHEIVDVFKQGNVILHVMKIPNGFKQGQDVKCQIDFERRKQLSQHHSGVHLVNGICQMVLGQHSWQMGTAKTPEKARLDIRNYELLTEKQLKEIEEKANELIKKNLKIETEYLPREIAEEKYGYRIYQGGFIPGRKLRIVKIVDDNKNTKNSQNSLIDVEACGGTHLYSTGEIEQLKILGCTKIQDGVVRITLVCGNAAKLAESGAKGILEETAKALGVPKQQVPARAQELFEKWKKAGKLEKRIKELKVEEKQAALKELQLTSTESRNLSDDELLHLAAAVFKTQPEHVAKTAARFLKELEMSKGKLAN